MMMQKRYLYLSCNQEPNEFFLNDTDSHSHDK